MEKKIGEIFEYNGEWYQVVECSKDNYPCIGCCGCKGVGGARIFGGECNGNARQDRRFVIFKKLEKVGDPYLAHDHSRNKDVIVQDYKLHNQCACYNGNEEILAFSYNGNKGIVTIKTNESNCNNPIEIEIKQNKEDMEEEREYSEEEFKNNPRFQHHKPIEQVNNMKKMKPFNLEEAKAGKPVCTRDGRKVRIICFDRKDNTPIVEILQCVHNDGKCFHYDTSNNDLMMLPEKKEGWILLRKDGYTFDNEEVAKKNCTDEQFVAKVEWEE